MVSGRPSVLVVWIYEYSDYIGESGESIEFDSYIIPTEEQDGIVQGLG